MAMSRCTKCHTIHDVDFYHIGCDLCWTCAYEYRLKDYLLGDTDECPQCHLTRGIHKMDCSVQYEEKKDG